MQGEKLETKHNHRNNQIVHGIIRSWARPVSCSWKRLLKAVLSTTMCEFIQPKCFTRFYQGCRRQSNSKITSFQNKNNNKNPINSFNLSWPVAYTHIHLIQTLKDFQGFQGFWEVFLGQGSSFRKEKKIALQFFICSTALQWPSRKCSSISIFCYFTEYSSRFQPLCLSGEGTTFFSFSFSF